MPSPPLGVHERGSHGCRVEVDEFGAWKPGTVIGVVVVVVPAVDFATTFGLAVVEVATGVVGAGELTAKVVPVTTVTGAVLVGS